MDYWHVTIRCTFPREAVMGSAVEQVSGLLADHVGHLAADGEGRRCTARLYVPAVGAHDATVGALRTFAAVTLASSWPTWIITEVHARHHFSGGREVVPARSPAKLPEV